jgi:hypothetical protein
VFDLPAEGHVARDGLEEAEEESERETIDVNHLYEQVFSEFPSEKALRASLEERRASSSLSMKSSSMIYGELVDLPAMFSVFGAILRNGNWSYKENTSNSSQFSLQFCDIGSGTGRVSIGAALFSVHLQQLAEKNNSLYIFEPCEGVELMDSLFTISEQTQRQYEQLIQSYSLPEHIVPTVSFRHGSLLDLTILDWTKHDVVFANSTCFDEVLMEDIGTLASTMQQGSILVTMSKVVPASAGFVIMEEIREKTSW